MNFIHLRALSEVEVDFFYDNIYLSKGITLLKFIVSSLLIFWMFCINSSFDAKLAFLTSSSSCDIKSKIASNTSSNFSNMIFLNRYFDWFNLLLLLRFWPFIWRLFYFDLFSTWALKNEKNNLNHIKVDNFVKLEDFPFATRIKIQMILFIVYSLTSCSNFPYWNFSFIYRSKFPKHSSVLFLKFFSLSPNINSKSSRI